MDLHVNNGFTSLHFLTLFTPTEKCILGTIFVIIVICNLFSLLVLYRIRDMHDVTKLLMMVLTTTDIAVGLFGFLNLFLPGLLGKVVNLSQIFGLNILAMITIVRYIAVSRPLRLETFVTKRRAYISLIIACLICLTLTIISVLFVGPGGSTKNQILLLYGYPLIPILIVFILYCKLLFIARHQARRIAAAEINAANAQAQLRRSNFKALNTFMIITGTTIVTWLPYSVSVTLHSNISSELKLLFGILRFSNSWLNTLIYCWMNESFRKVAKRLFRRNARVIPDILV